MELKPEIEDYPFSIIFVWIKSMSFRIVSETIFNSKMFYTEHRWMITRIRDISECPEKNVGDLLSDHNGKYVTNLYEC